MDDDDYNGDDDDEQNDHNHHEDKKKVWPLFVCELFCSHFFLLNLNKLAPGLLRRHR